MRSFISEDDIEQAILKKLDGSPYNYMILRCDPSPEARETLPDGTGRKDKKQCVLPDVLKEALLRLNPDIPADKIDAWISINADPGDLLSSSLTDMIFEPAEEEKN